MTALSSPPLSTSQLAELIARFDGRAPRYTSYPTALQFGPLGPASWLQTWAEADQQRPLSLYIHIPYCQHLCYYCGCFKQHAKPGAIADQLVTSLLQEMALYAPKIGRRPVVQLHLGGGTPSFLTAAQLRRLFAGLASYFNLQPQAGEFGMEIDPRALEPGYLSLVRELGINRLSLGVQDFNVATQRAIHRLQSLDLVAEVSQQIRGLCFDGLNYDLIYGLPKQSPASFAQTLLQVQQLRPDRVSLYSYAHMPSRFAPQRQISEADLPEPEDKLAMLLLAIDRLTAAGYHYIGMDHFAKASDPLVKAQSQGYLHRNFQGYSTQANLDLLALGPSAIGQVGQSFGQNSKDMAVYQASLEQGQLPVRLGCQRSQDDQERAWVIGRLACGQPVSFVEFEQRFAKDFCDHYALELQLLAPHKADGLVVLGPDALAVTAKGRWLLRAICLCFDAYFNSALGQRHSRII